VDFEDATKILVMSQMDEQASYLVLFALRRE
jgi:hypothetical protein